MRHIDVFYFVFVLMLVGVASGCRKSGDDKGKGAASSPKGAIESDPASLFTQSIKAYNEQDMSSLIQMFDPMLQWNHKTAAKLEIRGRAALANLFMQEKNIFPDREVTLRRLIVQNNELVAQGVARATHRGSAHGIEATGKKVSWEFGYFTSISKGKIKRTTVYFDPVATLRLLGTVSTEEPSLPSWPEKLETIRGSQSAENENRVKMFYALLGSESLGRLNEFVSQKSVFWDRGAVRTYAGPGEIRKYFEKMRADFEKLAFEVERVVSADGYVAAQVLRRGVYQMKPERSDKLENKEVEINEMHVFKMDGGKIGELDFYVDELQLFKQFGYSMSEAAVLLSEKKKPEIDAGVEDDTVSKKAGAPARKN
jgi:steroid delta-isomerase-like uncharacterized protein